MKTVDRKTVDRQTVISILENTLLADASTHRISLNFESLPHRPAGLVAIQEISGFGVAGVRTLEEIALDTSEKAFLRATAIALLVRIDPIHSLSAIIQCVGDKPPLIRNASASALKELCGEPARTFETIDGEDQTKALAKFAIHAKKEAAKDRKKKRMRTTVAKLCEAMETSKDANLLFSIADLLPTLREHEEFIGPLIKLTESEFPEVRASSVSALRVFSSSPRVEEKIVPAIYKLFQDPDTKVRTSAMDAAIELMGREESEGYPSKTYAVLEANLDQLISLSLQCILKKKCFNWTEEFTDRLLNALELRTKGTVLASGVPIPEHQIMSLLTKLSNEQIFPALKIGNKKIIPALISIFDRLPIPVNRVNSDYRFFHPFISAIGKPEYIGLSFLPLIGCLNPEYPTYVRLSAYDELLKINEHVALNSLFGPGEGETWTDAQYQKATDFFVNLLAVAVTELPNPDKSNVTEKQIHGEIQEFALKLINPLHNPHISSRIIASSLENPNDELMRQAFLFLAYLPNQTEAFETARKYLIHEEEEIRFAAAYTLASINKVEALKVLYDATNAGQLSFEQMNKIHARIQHFYDKGEDNGVVDASSRPDEFHSVFRTIPRADSATSLQTARRLLRSTPGGVVGS